MNPSADHPQTISTYEVPLDQWHSFFERISSQYQGEKIVVSRSSESADQEDESEPREVVFSDQPLGRIAYNAEHGAVEVQTEARRDVVIIEHARSVRFEQLGENGPGQLRVQAPNLIYAVRFAGPLVAGVLNGLP